MTWLKRIRPEGILLVIVIALLAWRLPSCLWIHHQQNLLRSHAEEFLALPIPKLLQLSSDELYHFSEIKQDPDRKSLAGPRGIISEYASSEQPVYGIATIAAKMNLAQLEILMCADAAQTDPEASNYVAQCQSILREISRVNALGRYAPSSNDGGATLLLVCVMSLTVLYLFRKLTVNNPTKSTDIQ